MPAGSASQVAACGRSSVMCVNNVRRAPIRRATSTALLDREMRPVRLVAPCVEHEDVVPASDLRTGVLHRLWREDASRRARGDRAARMGGGVGTDWPCGGGAHRSCRRTRPSVCSSGPSPRRSARLLPTRAISAPRSASSPSSTPGARRSSIIRICTASSRVGGSPATAAAGLPAAPGSSCRSGSSRATSVGCSSRSCRTPSSPGNCASPAGCSTLSDARRFAEHLRPARQTEWVVYAKRPFAGPEQVLDYLGRYTHRIAIANQRLCPPGRLRTLPVHRLPPEGGVAPEDHDAVSDRVHPAHAPSRAPALQFRAKGLCVSSGVVEAGCKQIGARLKRAGMRWTVAGANAIIAPALLPAQRPASRTSGSDEPQTPPERHLTNLSCTRSRTSWRPSLLGVKGSRRAGVTGLSTARAAAAPAEPSPTHSLAG